MESGPLLDLIRRASTDLPVDIEAALRQAHADEPSGSPAADTLGAILENVALARANNPDGLQIVCEVETVEEAVAAEEAGADVVMFDNFASKQIREALDKMAGKALTEVSGGVTLENVAAFAALGVDRISVGALTHSARALDISMEIVV